MSVTSATGADRAGPASSPEGAATAPGTPRRRAYGWGPLLLRLHFYAGVLVAPFLVVAALTGLAYTVTPQLDALVYGTELRAEPAGRSARPVSEQVAAARAAHPDGTLSYVALGGDGATTQVVFTAPELGEKQHSVYVDPYTGQVTGQLTTWFGYTPLRTWFDDLHRNLQLGVLGRHYSELAASWLWIVALGGLALWWRRHRGGRGRAGRLLLPDLAARRGVRRTRGWHASTGVWLMVGLLFLSATGLTWSRYAGANFGAGLDALAAGTPELPTSLSSAAGPDSGGGHHGGGPAGAPAVDPAAIDQVLRVARADGLTGPVEVGLPADASSAWTVTQVDDAWPVQKDRAAVDPAAGTVVARSDFADWPLLAKLSSLGISAHMGTLFGLANQILLAALALGLLCVIFWGYRMWWQRRPTRADRRAFVGAPPVARGAWWNLPTWAIVVGLPAVFLLCWALPLFGASLVGFLAVDLAVAAMRRRRRTDGVVPTSPAPAGS
ncbi:PepSY domain-containing protein [Plantactinospora mayteni]|uniref:Membrane protein n=1 Tax=Plantactinospora mayteni TaxID=566021 RepID=A0ABQ4F0L3_9ACTN|nr:PepSY domain-containing protein [Plantactinospora mayteni]GIH00448.1 membrane protein [Plantactinospora mayteni]